LRSRRESKSIGKKNLQQVQSYSAPGRGAGAVREYQAQAAARLKGSRFQVQSSKFAILKFEISNGVKIWHVSQA
jgi:hypothetical protein